jgi:hypothetical protein
MFESDFESTDEEAAQGDAVAGEATVQEEEKRVRKVSYICFILVLHSLQPDSAFES